MRMCITLCTPGEVSLMIVTMSSIWNAGGPYSRALIHLVLSWEDAPTASVASDVEDTLCDERLSLVSFLLLSLFAWYTTCLRLFLLLTRTMNLVSRVAIIKKLETKETYWYHFSIRPPSRGLKATCSVGTKSQGFLSQNDGKCLDLPWLWYVQASSEANRREEWMTMFEATQPV